ncbi:MAG: hypothetical protein WCO71_13780, partial [Pseudomonadota bacterium]
HYTGMVGSQRAEFNLAWGDGDVVSGTYSYPDGKPIQYTLRGDNKVKGALELNEYTGKTLTARLSLKKNEENGEIVWRGTMKNVDGQTFAMSFSRKSEGELKASPATADQGQITGNKQINLKKQRQYRFAVKEYSELRNAPAAGYVDFPANYLGSATGANGITVVNLQLMPAYGGADIFTKKDLMPQKVTPYTSSGGNTIKVASKAFAGMSFKTYYCEVRVKSGGEVTQLNLHVSGRNLVRCVKTDKGGFDATFKDGSAKFVIPFENLDDFNNRDSISHHNDPKWWDAEIGTFVWFDGNRWHAERIAAGPGEADYSFLEAKTTKGKFE